jgi:hypothetical protein
VTSRLLPRLRIGAAATLLLVAPLCSGCTSSDAPAGPEGGTATAASSSTSTAAVPSTADGLASLLVEAVPSGLPRVPDDELDPRAGAKTIDDVARYGDDAAAQRQVLEGYGYQRGWERFWRSGTAVTSVFLDQFSRPDGASAYAADLARNDAKYYGGVLDSAPGDLPAGCVLMAHDDPAPQHGLAGPAAFSWCASGVFTVAVAAVAGSPADARAELAAVTAQQLDRLPAD